MLPKPNFVSRRYFCRLTIFLCLFAVVGNAALCACAQDGQSVPSIPGKPYTLHVYENLVQIPTMVLDRRNAAYQGLTTSDFKLRLDEGPSFHPIHVHVEGDDPLTVALVLDVPVLPAATLKNLTEWVADTMSNLLGPGDRLILYAVDCNLVRSAALGSETNNALARKVLEATLNKAALHSAPANDTPGCRSSGRLWDAMATVTDQVSAIPGRRIAVVVSDGYDENSTTTWNRLKEYADGFSLSIFAISPGLPSITPGQEMRNVEDPFAFLCEGTGGIVLDVEDATTGPALEHICHLVRQRYILDFSRPRNSSAGRRSIKVEVRDRKAVVLPGELRLPSGILHSNEIRARCRPTIPTHLSLELEESLT